MAKHNDLVYLEHVMDAIGKIEEYITGIDEAKFKSTSLIQDGVIRQIEIIGEALRNVSREFREKYSYLPWDDAIGMRDKLIHDYMGVDLEKVWETATLDIPRLKDWVGQIIEANNQIDITSTMRYRDSKNG
ncbi:hypothetical protein A3C34_03590 [Candidatus Amesbacteria bacterium RIFCSPHIGHO2_02_FULL_48_21]|uniref:DUF86 domain-containing protein n=4 Tax=Candidatus Amesiibacteriota TaxID=1752730 RepID=A0A1F4ZA32_9BACT|nr:MAG: hypothetical protein UY22_C0025G0013 [Candidatus Amesbacteria bacterium GW2011_GWC1_48_10]OGC89333.1 MAG: hypothetical protein A2V48_04625 [Candidatus Amesbacteria bacterium RBG_19FT_COMBO_48_16]OGC95785.1 MAG: hypothetical protein A3C34_03590 [Candidatus Amesbacteria bacterium RIFCSPHIGHO2_02_FULL_48_21]OGC98758.1 MAG: hypothetical protein A2W16_01915 [Candidatus Amesbacteria bacterium RBG_16_48_31]OGD03133.1 MAG: hypothetical protein A3E17_00975 [Candidatus Amesbacteria bacterium RIFC